MCGGMKPAGFRLVGDKACPFTGRVLPGRGSPFLEKGRKSTRGSHPRTPIIYGARKDTQFLLSHRFVPAIEPQYRQSLRRNYDNTLNLGFCGDITCGNCTRPFLSDHLPRPGFCPVSRTTAAGGGIYNTLEAALLYLSDS